MSCRKRKDRTFLTTFACVLVVIIGSAAHAQTIVELRVDGDSGDVPPPFGNADGSDWGPLAFKFLQDALADAAEIVDLEPDTIVQLWVAATVETNPYRPDQCATCGPGGMPGSSGDPTATFNLINNVEIYGGFLGTDHPVAPETQLSQRDPESNETVLSGDIDDPTCGVPAAGNCFEANGSTSCNLVECCEIVCAQLPDCCEVEWDQQCADLAHAICETCSDPNSGNCFEPNGSPGCDDPACCELVCGLQADCCEVEWDQQCANFATLVCGLCGDPGAGACDEIHPTPGCDDAECCAAVCFVNPACCSLGWDALCVQIASKLNVCASGPPALPHDPKVYHVVTAVGVDDTAALDGFTITDGSALGFGIHSSGGGVRISGASPRVIGCRLAGNAAIRGGGMAIDSGNPAVIGCTFSSNSATDVGGAMRILSASPAVIRSTFSGNSAPGHGGGAMDIAGGSVPIVVNASFIENTGDEAGAIHTEGGSSGGTFVNCLFSGNTSEIEGGAINPGGGGTLTFINCTLANNSVADPEGGGAIFTEESQTGPVILTNCILWGNLVGNDPDPQQIVDDFDVVTVTYSDVEGGWDCPAGMPICGNIGADPADDPLFVDPDGPDGMPGTEDDDLHLLAGSPCIDKGNPADGDPCPQPGSVIPCDDFDVDNDTFTDEPTPDLDLNDRVVYGGEVPGPIVDMGAYEHCDPQLCPWDLSGDCHVGILDLLALLAAWGTNPGGPPDFDGDGNVGILDLLHLLANWGPCPAAGGVAGDSFEEELAKAGLSQADWDAFKECMSTGTHAEQDNCLCWMQNYLEGCDGGTRQACSDHDPFTDCVGDLNGDCCVDELDADILLNQMGPCPAGPGACLGDLNGDCVVSRLDHRDLLGHFGACPTTQVCPSPPPGCDLVAITGLEGAVTLMGFAEVADYQAHISATSEGEAFVCACVLQVLLEAQP